MPNNYNISQEKKKSLKIPRQWPNEKAQKEATIYKTYT
jgi:hypothetical protein